MSAAMMPSAAAVTFAMLLVMLAAWLYQRTSRNSGWVDVYWTYGTGATCAVAAIATTGTVGATPWRPLLIAAMVTLWALRLGTYVARRVAAHREDVRYATVRQIWGRNFQRNMLGLLLLQAPVTGLLSIAVWLAARNPAAQFEPADALGLLVLLVAILGESIADRQMVRFRAQPANRGAVCDSGLWAWSRHPNYLFEILGWFAYPVIAFDRADPWTAFALISPLTMFLVVRFGTGVPALENAMLATKGDAYRAYQRRVGTIFPKIPL